MNMLNGRTTHFMIVAGDKVFDVDRVTTTNEAVIFFTDKQVGEIKGGNIFFGSDYNSIIEANKTVATVVKNGKSVYVTDGRYVRDVQDIWCYDGLLALVGGGPIGELEDDNGKAANSVSKRGGHDAWFNYN